MTQKQILAGALIVALGMVALPRPAFAPSVSDLADELNVLRAQLSDQQRRLELETQVKLNTLQEKLDDLRQRLSSIEWGQEKKLDALERRLSRIELFSR
jgi:hypothetical protein